jgi:hypothetical protein
MKSKIEDGVIRSNGSVGDQDFLLEGTIERAYRAKRSHQ